MSDKNIIKLISETDIHSITSGQVITDIVSVIKEVLENSIDANSKNIEIIIQNYSLNGIEIKDDGDGIEEEDFEKICFKNYTSKLSNLNDLMTMKSLGFRGEALNSLCFISDLVISTCTNDETGMGHELKYNHNGNLTGKELIPLSKGTIVKIENIFQNLPVRHKNFIKNYKKQYNKVVKLIQDYCIINYQVNIKVWNVNENGVKKLIMSNLGQKEDTFDENGLLNLRKLLKNCGNIFGGQSKLKGVGNIKFDFEMPEKKSFIKENHFEGGLIVCQGLISKTAFGFGRNQKADNQFIYINKRPIDYPKLQNLINEEYRKFNNLQYPFFVIDLKMPTTMLDLNVTPNKRTVLVHDELKFFELFREALITFWDVDGMSLYSNTSTQSTNIKRKLEVNEDDFDNNNSSRKTKLTKVEMLEDDNVHISLRSPTTKVSDEVDEIENENQDVEVGKNLDLELETQYKEDEGNDEDVNDNDEDDDDDLPHSSMIDASGSKALHNSNINRINKYRDFQSKITSFMNPAPDKYSKFSKNQSTEANEDQVEEEEEEEEEIVIEMNDKKHVEVIPSPRKLTTTNNTRSQFSQPPSTNENEDTSANTTLRTKLQTFLKESFDKSSKEPGINLSTIEKTLDFDIKSVKPDTIMSLINKNNSSNNSKNNKSGKKRTLYSTNDKIGEADTQEELLTLTVSKKDFLDMKVIGQFNLGFILCTRKLNTGYDMFIIDQHASDEKYNFEELTKNTVIKSQFLIEPVLLELNVIDELIVNDNKRVFMQNGFQIRDSSEGDNKLFLVALPLSEKTQFTMDDFYELIDLIKKAEASHRNVRTLKCSKVRTMFAMRACRMSTMIGKPLNTTAMKKIVNNLSSLDKPWNCPHGRPTIRHLMELKSYNSFDEDYQL